MQFVLFLDPLNNMFECFLHHLHPLARFIHVHVHVHVHVQVHVHVHVLPENVI